MAQTPLVVLADGTALYTVEAAAEAVEEILALLASTLLDAKRYRLLR